MGLQVLLYDIFGKRETPNDNLAHIMPPVPFFLLENVLQLWFVNGKNPIAAPSLMDALPDIEGRWEFDGRADDANQPEQIRRYCNQVIKDMGYLHQRKFMHVLAESRDYRTWLIKPSTMGLVVHQYVYGKNPEKVRWESRQVRLLEER